MSVKFNAEYIARVWVFAHTFCLGKMQFFMARIVCLVNVMDESEKSPTLGQSTNRKCPTLGTSELVNAGKMSGGRGGWAHMDLIST